MVRPIRRRDRGPRSVGAVLALGALVVCAALASPSASRVNPPRDGSIVVHLNVLNEAARSLGCAAPPGATSFECAVAAPTHGTNSPGARASAPINASAWIPVPQVTAPSPRYGAAMVDDVSDGYVLLFGGGTTPPSGGVVVFGDTWIFTNGQWSNITTVVGHAPPPRVDAGIAYDAADGYVVMFGGTTGVGGGAVLNDTWTYHDQVWSEVTGGPSPSARTGAAMTADAATGAVVLFGGCVPQNCTAGADNDTWTFHGGAWSRLSPVGPVPPARARASFAYDASDGELVLYGGGTATARFNDTWEMRDGNWTELHPAVAPSDRSIAGMVYDPAVGALVLFGGKYFGDFYADTWAFTGGNWTIVSAVYLNAPSPRGDPGMVYDPQMGCVLMIGGETFFPGTLNDTWVLTSTYGNVTGVVTPRTATVVVDGTALTVVSGGFREALLPGSHTLEALATGYVSQSDPFRVTEGASTVLSVTLAPSSSSATNSSSASGPVLSTTAWVVIAGLAASTGFLAGTTLIYRSRPAPPPPRMVDDEPELREPPTE